MADLNLNYEEYENWLAVVIGHAVTVDGLQDYCQSKLKLIQHNISILISQRNIPECVENCSKTHKDNLNAWCHSCYIWQMELETYIKPRARLNRIMWSNINSIAWNTDLDELAKVFMMKIPDSKNPLEDLSSILSLLRNCTEFRVPDYLMINATNVRNNYYAHFFRLKITHCKKMRCLNFLKALLNYQAIVSTQSARKAIDIIQRLKSVNHISVEIIDEHTRKQFVLLLSSRINNIGHYQRISSNQSDMQMDSTESLNIDYIIKRLDDFKNDTGKRQSFKPILSKICIVSCTISVSIFFVLIAYVLLQKLENNELENFLKEPKAGTECINLYFDEFGSSDWDFYYDVRALYNDSVIERKWLKNVLQTKIDESEKGVLFTSGMGFGKSSMVADIVCSDDSSVWYAIKKKVLTYHLCQYDVEMSREPTVFIRNIAAMLSKRYEFINKTIRSDNITDLFLSRTHCSKDPIGCFDRLVVNPLRLSTNLLDKTLHLVVVDAADECQIDGKKDIISVIYSRLWKLPSQIKFLVTSRDLRSIKNQLSDLSYISMDSHSNNIDQDLLHYIRYKTGGTNERNEGFVGLSKGNFLFLKLYLENCMELDTCSSDDIPNSLSKLYRSNLERIFGVNGEKFTEIAKSIFEVLCTSKTPMTLQIITDIIDTPVDVDPKYINHFIKNIMIHFLHNANGNFTLIHKSLKEFFVNLSPESPFYIEMRLGHQLIAKYAMETFKYSNYDLIEIAFHVGSSFDIELEDRFKFIFKEMAHRIPSISILHDIAKKVNSYRTANLIVKVLSNFSINALNVDGETAAFVAASYGNAETLRWFLDNGADIHFEKNKKENGIITNYYMVEDCTLVYFCGYNLLEIAAQNGHSDAVLELLKMNISINHKTSTGFTAVDLAVENGHFSVVKHILSSSQRYSYLYPIYKASENGHTRIVELLLRNGAKDVCRCQSYYHLENNLNFIERWQIVVCESALHAAVRNCHLDIIKMLLKENETALECPDRSGMTPLLSSIKNNCSAGFEFLLDNGANVTTACEKVYTYIYLGFLSDNQKEQLSNYKCPEGAKLSHIIAMNFNIDILKIFLKKNILLWNATDSSGLTPLHYSSCSKRIEGISIITRLYPYFNFSARSKNGSTPFHMSAYCKSNVTLLLHYSKTIGASSVFPLTQGIPDVLDNDERSVLHYFFLGHGNTEDDILLLHMFLNHQINMTRTDRFGRNFLHYAVKSGSIKQIQYLYNNMSVQDRIQILTQLDLNGETPLEMAFKCLPITDYSYKTNLDNDIGKDLKLPVCPFGDIFTANCKANYSLLLEQEEQMILYLMQLYRQNFIPRINVTNLIYIGAKSSSLYSILMIRVFYNRRFVDVVSKPMHIFELLHLYRGLYLAYIILPKTLAVRCNQPYTKHPFAAIISNSQDRFWTYMTDYNFLDEFLKDIEPSFLNKCFDSEGYNLLQRAAIGGNAFALKYLVNKGMDLTMLTKKNETVLDLIIKHSYYTENGKLLDFQLKKGKLFKVVYFSNHDYAGFTLFMKPMLPALEYDKSAHFVLSKIVLSDFNITFWRTKCCKANKDKLGLVQLAAAKGLIGFLMAAQRTFGKRVIHCFNQSLVLSPYNLAKQNNQMKIIDWFEGRYIQPDAPKIRVMFIGAN